MFLSRGEETEFFPGFGASDSDETNPHWPLKFQPLFQKVLLPQNCKQAALPEAGVCPSASSHLALGAVSQGCGARGGTEALFKQKSQG